MEVCPKCGHHNRIGARRRLDLFLDEEGREELGASLDSGDPLKFKDSKKYKDRVSAAQKATGENEALIVLRGQLKGMDLVAAAFEFSFMGGSMGSVVASALCVAQITVSNGGFPWSASAQAVAHRCRNRCFH